MTFSKTLRILVVDDNDINLLLAKKVLLTLNTEVETARNGQEAVDKALNNSFDAIFMDLHMPVMDGYEAVKKIRESNFEGIIFALTASVAFPDENELKTHGLNGYMEKPFKVEKVTEELSKYFGS